MEYLYIVCIGLLVFFSFSLFTKKNKALSERIFSFWIVLLLITVISFFIYAKGLARNYPVFITLICDSHLLHGAFLHIYVLAFTNPSFKFRRSHLWNLIPMLVQIIFKLYLNFMVGEMQCYQEGGCVEDDNIYVTSTNIYKYLVLGIYILLTWRVVLKYKNEAIAPRDLMRLEWVRQITMGVSFLYFGILLLQIGRYLFPVLFWERMLLGNTLTTLFIYIFLYLGNSYAYLFVSPSRSRFKNLSESFNPQACRQNIDNEEMGSIFKNLNEFMNKEKPFVKGQLTLKELSEMTGIPSISISQSINNLTGKSVIDYINTFRVNLLKEYLANPKNKNYKILALAEECGFTSKTTLIRIFRQHTGMTPGEFLKLNSND
jgi:AraC-like DNA-binding protein